MAVKSGAGTHQNRETGVSSRSSLWVLGAQALRPSSAAVPRSKQGARNRSGAARNESGPMCDVDITGGGFMCCATILIVF